MFSLSSVQIDSLISTTTSIFSQITTTSFDITHILEGYRRILKDTFSHPDNYIIEGYERKITFMNVPLKFYWDVSELRKMSNVIPVKMVPVSQLYPLVDLSNILTGFLFSENISPVFLAEIPFCNPNVCPVDGNHRIVSAYRRNIPTIPVQLFPCEYHIKALSNNSRKLFKVCCNILTYSLIAEGKCSLSEIESEIFKV